MVTARRISGLYAITPDLRDDELLYQRVADALDGGVRLLQYRDKNPELPARLRRAEALRRLCNRYNALLIVNDDVEVCQRTGADGVHLGRDDADVRSARVRLGSNVLIGVSCYDDFERARDASRQGADYVAFGSVFLSSVKPRAVRASLDLFGRARRELTLPVAAIGGIDLGNARAVLDAGADAIAVISALFDAPDVAARAREFAAVLAHGKSEGVIAR